MRLSITPCLCAALFALAASASAQSLSRITVSNGVFLDSATGDPFTPRGFNYIRLFDDRAWHATFAPDLYDPARAESALALMADHGFNTVRVFIDHEVGQGVVANFNDQSLSPTYMANFADFVSRAAAHGLRVIPSLVYRPSCYKYNLIAGPPPGFGPNDQFLHAGYLQAKSQYLIDFVSTLKAINPSLLSSIFAYELENEANYVQTAAPFNMTSGLVTTAASGKTYDMAVPADRQALADDHALLWADTLTAAIKSVDPAALVSANVFTYQAVGRDGPGDESSSFGDSRFPLRPLALASSSIDYLDVHTYPFSDNWLAADLTSVEWPQLQPALAAAGKPVIAGEFGAFMNTFTPTLSATAVKMRQHVARLDSAGFAGQLLWTYDTDQQTQIWNARSGRGELFGALLAENRRLDRSIELIISEKFSIGAGRASGGSLEGALTEFGGVTWAAGSALKLDASGYLLRQGSGGQTAIAPYNPSDAEIIHLTANVAVPPKSADWVGLGLTDTVSGNAPFWNDGSLWLLLRGSGQYEGWINGVSVGILPAQPAAPDFLLGGLNKLELIYDTSARRAWMLINGSLVLDSADTSPWSFTVTGAGLHFFADGSSANDFALNLLPYWSTLPADTNGDRTVNALDINPFIQALINPAAYAAAFPGLNPLFVADLNSDGLINALDIAPFVSRLTSAGTTVPEPSTVFLIASLLLYRRR